MVQAGKWFLSFLCSNKCFAAPSIFIFLLTSSLLFPDVQGLFPSPYKFEKRALTVMGRVCVCRSREEKIGARRSSWHEPPRHPRALCPKIHTFSFYIFPLGEKGHFRTVFVRTEHVGMRSSLVFFEKEEEEVEEVGKPLFVYANEVSFSLSKSRNCLFLSWPATSTTISHSDWPFKKGV